MDDISQKLSELLTSPEKLSQAMQIAGELMGSADAAPQPDLTASTPPSDLTSALSSLDPKTIAAMTSVLGALGRDDSKTALLHALRPHMRDGRAERIDRAIQILRMSSAIKAALGALKGGDDSVLKI